jgi:large subunit ribosomal protein L32
MAVPKRKTSRAKTHSRRSANRRLELAAHSLCPQCGASKLPHTVCPHCGYYRGRPRIDVD